MIEAIQSKLSFIDPKALKTTLYAILAVMAVFATIDLASAVVATGTEFQDAYDRIVGWLTGYLGKIVALLFIGVGVFMGIKAQSLWGIAVGIAFAMAIVEAPDIIDAVFGFAGMTAADLAAIAAAPVLH